MSFVSNLADTHKSLLATLESMYGELHLDLESQVAKMKNEYDTLSVSIGKYNQKINNISKSFEDRFTTITINIHMLSASVDALNRRLDNMISKVPPINVSEPVYLNSSPKKVYKVVHPKLAPKPVPKLAPKPVPKLAPKPVPKLAPKPVPKPKPRVRHIKRKPISANRGIKKQVVGAGIVERRK